MNTSRLSNLLGALALKISDALEDTVKRNAYTATTMSALISIDAHPGDTIDTLSKVLRLSPSGMSRAIARLEQQGLVERHRGKDGRAVFLFSTNRGRKEVQKFLFHRHEIIKPIVENLSETEQTTLLNALEKMLSTIPLDREDARNICRFCDETICHTKGCPVDRDTKDF